MKHLGHTKWRWQLQRERQLYRNIFINLLIACVTFLLSLILLEIIVRVGGQTDADGQFSFMGYDLEPYVLPVDKLRAPVEDYLHLSEFATIVYDDKLGWTFRPNSVRQGGTFTINSAGIRSQRDHSLVPPSDVLRIALFGDSFTAGDDASDDEVWGRLLELQLNNAGFRTEVLNFGVGAYGMDQAYLRWQSLGKNFQPDIVIFGLQPDNLKRNVNVFRQLIHSSGPPFSKPRFTLVSRALKLVNSPTLPPEHLIPTFEDFANHPLAAYEHFYHSRYVVSNWWASSRLASFLFATLKQDNGSPDIFGEDAEGGQLGKAIADAFAKDVTDQDAAFIVLHLPIRSHLIRHFNRSVPPYKFLLDYLDNTYHYIATEHHISYTYVDEVYWGATNHYGPEINEFVAQLVAAEIQSCIEDSSCKLPRFSDTPGIFKTK